MVAVEVGGPLQLCTIVHYWRDQPWELADECGLIASHVADNFHNGKEEERAKPRG